MNHDDLTPDLNTTAGRNRDLDLELLKTGDEIADLTLRPITAGDLALLMEMNVGLVMGRTDSIGFDVGAILYAQSHGRDEIRKLASRLHGREEFREAVYGFLDSYEPGVFSEATPRILELVNRVMRAKTSVKGEAGTGDEPDPKAGGQAG